MNDEIKEILEDLRNKNMSVDDLTHNDKTKLLDYITNLQKENEELKQDNIIGCKKFIKQRQIIDKANDELQKLIDDINNKTIIGLNNFLSKLEVIQDELVGGDE